MVLSSTQTTLVALALLNSGVSLIYNPLLLYALLKGNILRSKCNHDFMTLLLLFGLIFTSFADFVIVVFLLSLGITTKDSTTLCNSSAIAVILGVGIIMSCLLLYAIDLWYKIHRLKELKFSTFVIMFVAFFAGQFIAIGLAFSNNKGEQPVFQSLGIGVICFYVLTPVSSNSERFLTLLPAIINIVYLALTINVVIHCYTMVYLRVRQVRSGVKAMEASLTTANPDSIISIPKSADISGPSTGELPPRSHTKVDKVEQEVFRMSVAILLVMIVCWTPILIVFVTKLIIQEEIPMWAEFISISTALLDVSFLTPTILIRFNRHYRKLWFEHVLKFEFLKRSWIVKLIFGVPPN